MHKCWEKERKREDHDSLGIREKPIFMWAEQNLAGYILFSIFVIFTILLLHHATILVDLAKTLDKDIATFNPWEI